MIPTVSRSLQLLEIIVWDSGIYSLHFEAPQFFRDKACMHTYRCRKEIKMEYEVRETASVIVNGPCIPVFAVPLLHSQDMEAPNVH